MSGACCLLCGGWCDGGRRFCLVCDPPRAHSRTWREAQRLGVRADLRGAAAAVAAERGRRDAAVHGIEMELARAGRGDVRGLSAATLDGLRIYRERVEEASRAMRHPSRMEMVNRTRVLLWWAWPLFLVETGMGEGRGSIVESVLDFARRVSRR